MKKIIIIGISFLAITFVGLSGCFEENTNEETSGVKSRILYVDDDGERNFNNIQDAINASYDGDNIFVYNGFYEEKISINKKITLQGEDKNNTIINALNNDSAINVKVDNVKITGFTIKNASRYNPENVIIVGGTPICGIVCHYNNNIIYNNIIKNCDSGIYLNNTKNNIIEKNFLNNSGIYLKNSSNNFISTNIITNSKTAILILRKSINNTIEKNDLISNDCGLSLNSNSDFNDINNNNFINNEWEGIRVESNNNLIFYNKFENNKHYGLQINDNAINNSIKYNTFSKCKIGIGIYYTNNITIQSNRFISNSTVINVQDSNDTKIFENDIDYNRSLNFHYNDNVKKYKIRIIRGYYNIIYKNNFRNSSEYFFEDFEGNNTWYNESLNIGNYWDDYEGIDSDDDGIGDSPYIIKDTNKQDMYPLVEPVEI